MSLPPLVTADGTKGSTWPKAINPWAGGGLCLVLIRKDGVIKQIPPRTVNTRCPEAEQLASAVEAERIQRDKVKITSTQKASWSDEGKRNDEQEEKNLAMQKGEESRSTEMGRTVWSTWSSTHEGQSYPVHHMWLLSLIPYGHSLYTYPNGFHYSPAGHLSERIIP